VSKSESTESKLDAPVFRVRETNAADRGLKNEKMMMVSTKAIKPLFHRE